MQNIGEYKEHVSLLLQTLQTIRKAEVRGANYVVDYLKYTAIWLFKIYCKTRKMKGIFNQIISISADNLEKTAI